MQEFLKQQRTLICTKLGHSWALPLQSELRAVDGKREVLCVCRTCESESWQEIPPEKWDGFLRAMKLEASTVEYMGRG